MGSSYVRIVNCVPYSLSRKRHVTFINVRRCACTVPPKFEFCLQILVRLPKLHNYSAPLSHNIVNCVTKMNNDPLWSVGHKAVTASKVCSNNISSSGHVLSSVKRWNPVFILLITQEDTDYSRDNWYYHRDLKHPYCEKELPHTSGPLRMP